MKSNKLDFIDALRGFAACYVALFHLPFITFPSVKPPAWFEPFADSGMSGVSLFFVISAFTLCLSMSSRADEATPTLNYFIRRFFRIAPLFYIWIAIACFRDYTLFHKVHSAKDVLLNAVFAFNFSPSTVDGIPWAAWTIGVEMVFYLFFPLIFRTLDGFGKAILALCVTALIGICWERSFVGAGGDFWMFGFLSRLPIFILGIAVYHLYKEVHDSAAAKRWGAGYAFMGLAVFGYFAISYLGTSETILPRDYQQALCWATCALGLSLSPVKLVVNRLTRFMGTISYSFYLTHATILHLLSGLFAWLYVRAGNPTAGYFASYIAAVAIIGGLSYLQYRVVEQAGNNLGRRIIARMNALHARRNVRAEGARLTSTN